MGMVRKNMDYINAFLLSSIQKNNKYIYDLPFGLQIKLSVKKSILTVFVTFILLILKY